MRKAKSLWYRIWRNNITRRTIKVRNPLRRVLKINQRKQLLMYKKLILTKWKNQEIKNILNHKKNWRMGGMTGIGHQNLSNKKLK